MKLIVHVHTPIGVFSSDEMDANVVNDSLIDIIQFKGSITIRSKNKSIYFRSEMLDRSVTIIEKIEEPAEGGKKF